MRIPAPSDASECRRGSSRSRSATIGRSRRQNLPRRPRLLREQVCGTVVKGRSIEVEFVRRTTAFPRQGLWACQKPAAKTPSHHGARRSPFHVLIDYRGRKACLYACYPRPSAAAPKSMWRSMRRTPRNWAGRTTSQSCNRFSKSTRISCALAARRSGAICPESTCLCNLLRRSRNRQAHRVNVPIHHVQTCFNGSGVPKREQRRLPLERVPR